MAILSIQSQVSVGHAGNSAAVFPIQRLGLDVWPVHTTLLSNHKGYDDWRGYTPEARQLDDIISGIERHGALGRCRAVLVGYLASTSQARVVAEAVEKVRAANEKAIFCLDPVMGEKGEGLYVEPGIPEVIAQKLAPLADIVTPNPFELEFLSGREIASLDDALKASEALRARGPGFVICTSCASGKSAKGKVETLAVGGEGAWRVVTPLLPSTLYGTGDAFAAIFLVHYLERAALDEALSRAVSAVYGLMKATFARDPDAEELDLVAAQEEIVAPSEMFKAERVR